MKIFKNLVSIVLISAICFSFAGCSKSDNKESDPVSSNNSSDFNIVSSFYPMHILSMNLVKGIDDVSEKSMADPNMGCIHDHTFSTDDLKKIENADVYIENGLDMETFNDKIKTAYPDTSIIEASEDIKDYVKDGSEINGHVWTNIDNYIKQVQSVSSKLQSLNPQNKDKYAANEKAYVDKLTALKDEYKDKLAKIEGKKVLILDETLPYFCDFTKLDYREIETDHEQEAISAGQLKDTIADMKKENIKTILIAKDGDRKNAEAIAAETGADIYELNTCMTGDVNEDAYLNYMKENFDIISDITK